MEEGRETSDTPVGQCRRQDLWKKVGKHQTCGTVQETRLVEDGKETSDTPVGQCRGPDLWKTVGKHQTHLWDSAGGQDLWKTVGKHWSQPTLQW